MNAPGKTMLKVTSIILIVLGSLGVLGSACIGCSLLLMDVIPIEQIMDQLPQSTIDQWNLVKASITPMFVIGSAVAGLANLMELIFGIIGARNCGKPEKGTFFIGAGIALLVLFIASMCFKSDISFVITLFSLALPILFIVGGVMNNKAAAASEPTEPVQ